MRPGRVYRQHSWAFAALVAVAAIVAQACGSGTSSAVPPTSAPSQSAAAVAPSQAASAEASGAVAPSIDTSTPVNLVYWNWKFDQPPFKQWISWAESEYQKTHPNVTFTHFTPADIVTEVQTAIAGGGDVPDLVATYGAPYEFSLAKEGLWVDLKPFIDKDPDWSAQTQKIWSSVPKIQYTYGDQVIAAPISGGPFFVYYWKDIFEKAGVEPPKTIDDLLALPDKLKSAGVDVMTTSLAAQGNQNELFWALTAGIDQAWTDEHQADNCAKPYTGDPVAKQAMESLLKLYTSGVFRKQALQEKYDPDTKQVFSDRKAAMFYPAGTWINGGVADNIDKIGVMTFPGTQSVPPSVLNSYDIGIGALNVTEAQKDPAHQAAVADYLKFLTSTASQQEIWDSSLMPLDPAAAAQATTPDQKVTAEQVTMAADPGTKAVYYTTLDPRMFNSLDSSVSAMLIGDKTADQVLADIDAACAKAP